VADEAHDVGRLAPGIVCALAELDEDLAPAGGGMDSRQRLEIERARQRKPVAVAADDNGRRDLLRGDLLLGCWRTGQCSSGSRRERDAMTDRLFEVPAAF
jgi:hypothetical protein